MLPRWTIATLLLAGAVSATGCLAIGPFATVKAIEGLEQATGIRLDPTPAPPPVIAGGATRLDEVPGSPTPGASNGPTDPSASPELGPDGQPLPSGSKPGGSASPGVDPAKDGIVDMNEYNRIMPGMTYEEVVAICGREGQLLPATRAKVYLWHNPNGSFVRVVFSAERVSEKEQQRLS